jgi:predicted nucleic acid-binding protein
VCLVDTNVLSVGAPTKVQLTQELVAWMERNSERMYLSVITVAEVDYGIAKSRRTGAITKADRLAEWLETLLHLYSNRILPLDVTVARLLGRLTDLVRGAGQTPGLADLAIAATAASRGYIVLTRNPRQFRALAIPAHDPFATLPTEPDNG